MQMLIIVFAAFSGMTLALAATNDGWEDFPQDCSSEIRDEWFVQVENGRAWTKKSTENLRDLDEMSQKICPAYFDHPNDAAQINAFVRKKDAILDQSPVVEKQGKDLLAFLRIQMSDYQATFSEVEINFSTSPCGTRMANISSKMNQRLVEIRRNISSLAQTCFAASAQFAKTHPNVVQHSVGQGVPASAKRGDTTSPSSSEVTGILEDMAKQKLH